MNKETCGAEAKSCRPKSSTPRETIEAALLRLGIATEDISQYLSGLRGEPPATSALPPKAAGGDFETFLKSDIVDFVDLATDTLRDAFLNLRAIIEGD